MRFQSIAEADSVATPSASDYIALRNRDKSVSTGAVPYCVAVCDIFIVVTTSFVIYFLYLGGRSGYAENVFAYLITTTIYATALVSIFAFSDLYKLDNLIYPYRQIRKIVVVSTIIAMVLVSMAFALKISDQFSRFWSFTWWITSTSLICLARIAAYYIIRGWAKTGRLSRNIAIVGAGPQGTQIAGTIKRLNQPWNTIIGFFDSRSAERILSHEFTYQLMGTLDDLCQFTREHRVDDVILAIPWHADTRILEILGKIRPLPVNVHLGPDLIALRLPGRRFNTLGNISTLDVAPKPFSGWRYLFKFVEDRIVGGIIFILFIPLMVLIGILIKLDSAGPILFKQKRYGFNSKLISVYKFRTMYHDQKDDGGETLTTRADPRVTRIGAYLRRLSLDELPQLINVMKGEMSLIGPRPHATQAKAAGELYENAVMEYAVRHKVRPGISGWAQVNGWRGDTDTIEKLKQRVHHDIYYIENWSIKLEIKILVKTVFIIFKQTNAY